MFTRKCIPSLANVLIFSDKLCPYLQKNSVTQRNIAFTHKGNAILKETLFLQNKKNSLSSIAFIKITFSFLTFPGEILHSLAKVLHFPEKLCIHLKNDFISQKNFAFTYKDNAIPRETWQLLAKHLHFLKQILCFSENICICLQQYCLYPRNFAFT